MIVMPPINGMARSVRITYSLEDPLFFNLREARFRNLIRRRGGCDFRMRRVMFVQAEKQRRRVLLHTQPRTTMLVTKSELRP